MLNMRLTNPFEAVSLNQLDNPLKSAFMSSGSSSSSSRTRPSSSSTTHAIFYQYCIFAMSPKGLAAVTAGKIQSSARPQENSRYKVLRKAIRSCRSAGFNPSPKGWPAIERAFSS
jgi:hypothetical protein